MGERRVPESDYRLIVMDLDGTLLNGSSGISPRTRAALERVSAAGVAIAVATGRSYTLLKYFCNGLPLTGPQITFNGAIVMEPVSERPLFMETVPPALIVPVLSFLREQDMFTCYFTDRDIYVRGRSELEREVVPPGLPQPIEEDNLEGLIHLPCVKLVAIARPERITALRRLAEPRFGDRLYVTQTAPVLLEFLHPAVSKGAALREVIRELGLDASRVIAFGDSHNDIGMLETAGMGVAMANASPEVQAVADRIAPSNEEDGIAVVLDALVPAR